MTVSLPWPVDLVRASVEYHGGTRADAVARIDELLRANTAELLAEMSSTGLSPRSAAHRLARTRLDSAHAYRRTY
jgi:glutamate dehydrogenase (NAD(P)+)